MDERSLVRVAVSAFYRSGRRCCTCKMKKTSAFRSYVRDAAKMLGIEGQVEGFERNGVRVLTRTGKPRFEMQQDAKGTLKGFMDSGDPCWEVYCGPDYVKRQSALSNPAWALGLSDKVTIATNGESVYLIRKMDR